MYGPNCARWFRVKGYIGVQGGTEKNMQTTKSYPWLVGKKGRDKKMETTRMEHQMFKNTELKWKQGLYRDSMGL